MTTPEIRLAWLTDMANRRCSWVGSQKAWEARTK
jgi:hypothetical protein